MYKNVNHYRRTVHRYLDGIWLISSNRRKARTSMYSWLSKQMDLPPEKTHVKYFNRDQCRQAIRILRPMYIKLYGKDLPWRKEKRKMYYVTKQMQLTGAHRLTLDYDSKCQELHGHDWKVTMFCKSKTLDTNGMVIDFIKIKENIFDKLDHTYFNDVVDFNPTLENMAKWICDQILPCYKVTIQESEENIVTYEEDED